MEERVLDQGGAMDAALSQPPLSNGQVATNRPLPLSTPGTPYGGLMTAPRLEQDRVAGAASLPPALEGTSAKRPLSAVTDAGLLANAPSRPRMGAAAVRRAAGNAAGDNKTCNCKNSRCLKLYCECFASGRYCNACNCMNCMNNRDHETARSKAIEVVLERNPNAFRPKIQIQQGEDGVISSQVTRHSKGCSCRRSNCLKKYCECFQAGIFCAQTCRCKECKNYEGSMQLLAMMDHMEAGVPRAPPQLIGAPEGKRVRVTPTTLNPPTLARAPPGLHYVQYKEDPARHAIKLSREKKMHEVLASVLTALHMDAIAKERKKRRLAKSNTDTEARGDAVPEEAAQAQEQREGQREGQLSEYYVRTEGLLLGEFGNFLGNIADRMDEQKKRFSGE